MKRDVGRAMAADSAGRSGLTAAVAISLSRRIGVRSWLLWVGVANELWIEDVDSKVMDAKR